jgi:hypothetical protein
LGVISFESFTLQRFGKNDVDTIFLYTYNTTNFRIKIKINLPESLRASGTARVEMKLWNNRFKLKSKTGFSSTRAVRQKEMKTISLLLIFALVLLGSFHDGSTAEGLDPMLRGFLDNLKQPNGGYPQTLDLLHEVAEKSQNPDQALISLLDYYIGAAAGEVLPELITKRGKAMMPLLLSKKRRPLECAPQYIEFCAKDVEFRNNEIDAMIEAINEGRVLCADCAESPKSPNK